jgi:hypothetical protein
MQEFLDSLLETSIPTSPVAEETMSKSKWIASAARMMEPEKTARPYFMVTRRIFIPME